MGGDTSGNEWYFYEQDVSGTLAPGQSFTIKFLACNGGGDQPFPQSTVWYQKLSGKNLLSGYVLSPSGVKQSFGQASSTSGDYNAMTGGVIRGQGEPGLWTFVITNPTRKPIQVYMGNFKMILE